MKMCKCGHEHVIDSGGRPLSACPDLECPCTKFRPLVVRPSYNCKCGHDHETDGDGIPYRVCIDSGCRCMKFDPAPTFVKWTVARLKEELPNVPVIFNGKTHDAELAGSRCDHPLLIVTAVLDGKIVPLSFVGNWQKVADSLNDDLPIDISG